MELAIDPANHLAIMIDVIKNLLGDLADVSTLVLPAM
jgi:hypothetical protein